MKLCCNCVYSKYCPELRLNHKTNKKYVAWIVTRPNLLQKIKWCIFCMKCQKNNLNQFKSK